jgi:hypothetical protein
MFVPKGSLGCDNHVRDYLLATQTHLILSCCCNPQWARNGCEAQVPSTLLVSKCLYALQAAELSSSGRWVFSKCLVALREVLQPVAVAVLEFCWVFCLPMATVFNFCFCDQR